MSFAQTPQLLGQISGQRIIAASICGLLAVTVGLTGCASGTAGDSDVEYAIAVDDPREEFRMSLIGEGLLVEEAGAEAELAGYSWRVGEIDGEPQALTMDYREDRLTFSVEGGIVTDAVWG